jgi:hypothetical protein
VLVVPVETGPENSGQLIHNGRRYEKHIAIFQGRSPSMGRIASPVGEDRNIDVGVERFYSATPSRSRFSKFSELPGRYRGGVPQLDEILLSPRGRGEFVRLAGDSAAWVLSDAVLHTTPLWSAMGLFVPQSPAGIF